MLRAVDTLVRTGQEQNVLRQGFRKVGMNEGGGAFTTAVQASPSMRLSAIGFDQLCNTSFTARVFAPFSLLATQQLASCICCNRLWLLLLIMPTI